MEISVIIGNLTSFLTKYSPELALCAMFISLLSFCVSAATFRRAGPRLRVWHSIGLARYTQEGAHGGEFACLQILTQNSGLATVGITNFQLERPVLGLLFNPLVIFLKNHVVLIDGASLDDLTVPGGTSNSWTYEIKVTGLGSNTPNDTRKILKRLRWTKLNVSLGNGKNATKRRFQPFSAIQSVGTFRHPGPEDPEAQVWAELTQRYQHSHQYVLAGDLVRACGVDRSGAEDILSRWSTNGRVIYTDSKSGRGYAPAPGWEA
jgi:hypothetical protein